MKSCLKETSTLCSSYDWKMISRIALSIRLRRAKNILGLEFQQLISDIHIKMVAY